MSVRREHDGLYARIRHWLAPLRVPGALPRGFLVEEIETEQGITLTLGGPEGRIRVELERADPARACFATTALFNVYYDGSGRDGPLRDVGQLVDAVVRVVRANEAELRFDDAGSARSAVREIEVDRGLVREREGAYYANPYVGCMLGCAFCYAQGRADFSRALDGRASVPWGKWVDVKVNLAEVVAREVKVLPPGTVRMSPIVTDPYQPIERRYRVTRGVLGALVGSEFSPIVLTRSSLVIEDVPLLASFPRAFLGVSVPTDDDAVRTAFEPNTEPISARLDTLRLARAAGVVTFAVIQPMLPLTPRKLVAALDGLVDAVRMGPLFEKPLALPMFRALGRSMPSESDERATFEELRALFERRGIRVNPRGGDYAFLEG